MFEVWRLAFWILTGHQKERIFFQWSCFRGYAHGPPNYPHQTYPHQKFSDYFGLMSHNCPFIKLRFAMIWWTLGAWYSPRKRWKLQKWSEKKGNHLLGGGETIFFNVSPLGNWSNFTFAYFSKWMAKNQPTSLPKPPFLASSPLFFSDVTVSSSTPKHYIIYGWSTPPEIAGLMIRAYENP